MENGRIFCSEIWGSICSGTEGSIYFGTRGSTTIGTKGSISSAFPSLWAKDDKFIPENTNINRNYNSVMNLRMGAELIQDDFRFRAGYARYPSPYKSNMVSDLKAMVNNVYTLGFGIKTDSYSFDLAYVNSGNNTAYPPYELNNKKQPMANNVVRTSNLILTAGFNID